ncbi:Cingulin [Xenopus (Silurana) tropicalis] [Rhizoctonia solani]|uniref:Cingulin [Xenopus (Silurana) tropicalis] n=1 Tax=Rhizoctonia solani TaxID=456999 RepID=A0A0K6FUE4_9AGAM|nr:Cingulin [Xenopus (Silurana) tropicalis] [Rhizoctonia solani]
MNCTGDGNLIQQLQSLEVQFLKAIGAGADACAAFSSHLETTLAQAQQRVLNGQASAALTQLLANATHPLNTICSTFMQIEHEGIQASSRQAAAIQGIFAKVMRRRRKRSTRSRKSKAGKSGKVRQSGKKSKRGRKSPVGNPKRRVHTEVNDPGLSTETGKKSRTVTAPPTDSMKFGACRDFFLSHLGDPYPTTVQKHQILKQSSSDFTLRSLNLWFVNTRRRSKWMDIFKKHAGSKRDAMRDLVARVEAQVAGRPAPNPLPSGAAPPGCRVDQGIVEEVMAMRAVVDMVSREVYGEGWDQILQIRPWTDEEVRAHEERKKATRRQARESKVDGEKKKQEREALKEQRKRSREERKRIEQSAVQGIHAARELHEKLMSMNKRKRDDNDDGSQASPKRRKDQEGLNETDGAQRAKVRVPKVDENGNPLSKKERKALKKAILAAQANPLKRKSPEFGEDVEYPNGMGAAETGAFPDGLSPSKRRRRDAATFEGFPGAGPTEAGAMTDLTQLFSIEWASPTTSSAQLPPSEHSPTPVPVPAPAPAPATSNFGEFADPAESQNVPMLQTHLEAPAEQPRRYSQQLAAYALESGMFGGDNFELFSEDTFPNMSVDLHAESNMPFLPNHATPVQAESHSHTHTPMPNLASTPVVVDAPNYNFPPPSHAPPSPYSSASTITPNGDADSDMSWLNAALAQLPSEHDAQHHHQHQYSNAPGPQDGGFNTNYTSTQNAYNQPVFTAPAESRAPVSHQRTSMEYAAPQQPPQPQPQSQPQMHTQQPTTPSIPQQQPRRSFPHSGPSTFPHPQPRRAPGSLWQTPYSQPQTYHHQPTSFSAPPPPPSPSASSRSFPAPAQHHYDPNHDRRGAYTHAHSASPQEYNPTPAFPQPQSQSYAPPAPTPAPAPVPDAASILKQHELEFARAQEELRNRFKREQDEQLERFLRAQDELKKQLLPESGRL